MATDSALWRDRETRAQTLPNAERLTAIFVDGQWTVCDGPEDDLERERLHELYRCLATECAIAAGAPNRANALDYWLNLLRDESPHFHPTYGTSNQNGVITHDEGGWIEHLALATAEYCAVRASRAFELENVVPENGNPPGLRRDRYPFCYWLYDHPHEPGPDPKAEFEYWEAHVWRGYHALIEAYERMGMAWADRREKLNSATAALSYDLAVLQANYVIDRGLRGEEAMRTFRDESGELVEEVTSSWRSGRERLAITVEDDTEEAKDLAQPFHRVRDDLRRLLSGLPAASFAEPRAETEGVVPTRVAGRKKRGRPQTIPDNRKAAALEVKNAGGSNKDAAKKLYDVIYPTPTQVKSVTTILRLFRKKLAKLSRKSRKDRG